MSKEGHKAWALLSEDDRLLVLEQAPSTTLLLMESVGSQCGCGRGMFARQCDKLRAFLHDLKAIDDTSNTTTDTTATTEPHSGEGDLIDSVCDTFDVDFETLYAHAVKCHSSMNKDKHRHWKPPKGSTLPPGVVHRMMADRAEINIDGHKYTAKKADAALHPTDVLIDGVRYAINMMRISILLMTDDHRPATIYHVSTSRHSDKTGALVDCSANGGIAGSDCHIIEETNCFINMCSSFVC